MVLEAFFSFYSGMASLPISNPPCSSKRNMGDYFWVAHFRSEGDLRLKENPWDGDH